MCRTEILLKENEKGRLPGKRNTTACETLTGRDAAVVSGSSSFTDQFRNESLLLISYESLMDVLLGVAAIE